MRWKISIEAKIPGDARTVYRLRIDDTVIADQLTTAQAEFLVGEILDRETADAEDDRRGFLAMLRESRSSRRRSILPRPVP